MFDLDGTLLNRESAISPYTSETLRLLSEREIAYTVATGRTLHGARAILEGHRFELPQAYKNGVMIWHPTQQRLSSGAVLTAAELDSVIHACLRECVAPFVFTLDEDEAIDAVFRSVEDQPHLVAYSGIALEGQQWRWIDIHHSDAKTSKYQYLIQR